MPNKLFGTADLLDEKSLGHFQDNVAYGATVQHRPTGKVVVFGSYKPLNLPKVGETFQVQAGSGSISGTVTSIHHTYDVSPSSPPFLTCHVWVVLT
jgi:hypothetical protein